MNSDTPQAIRRWKCSYVTKRRAVKWQLRRLGVSIPETATYDLKALRALRAA